MNNVEEQIDIFTNIIYQTALLIIQKYKFSDKKRPVPWFVKQGYCKMTN